MRKRYSLVWVRVVFVFLFARMDVAYAIDNTTTANGDHAAAITNDGIDQYGGDNSILETSGSNAAGVYINGIDSSWTFGDGTTIKASGYNGPGAYIHGGTGSAITFNDNTNISVSYQGLRL